MKLSISHWIREYRSMRVGKQKDKIRSAVSAQRKALTHDQINQLSEQVMLRLESLPEFRAAQSVLIYYPLRNEVDTRPLINRWYQSKRILLPVINGHKLDIRPYEGEDHMAAGKYGIMEPTGSIYTGPIDLIVIPGVAFDRKLNRLGRGKGYYDRFLHGRRDSVVGVCYDFQLLKSVPTLSHDHRVRRVITPTETVG